MPVMERWTILNFGKHKGRTLPYVLLHDPDWFFWAWDEGVFRGPYRQESRELAAKAKRIRIPRDRGGRLVVDYFTHPATGRFVNFEIVDEREPLEGAVHRTKCIDLSVPRLFGGYDKLGGQLLLRQVKPLLFRTSKARLTAARCEKFFEDDENFLLPERD